MEAIDCAVQPRKEGCSKDCALSNQPLGSSQAMCASHRQDHELVVLMEKGSMETIAHQHSHQC